MRIHRSIIPVLLFIPCALGCGSKPAAPTHFTLRFQPADGTEFVQRMQVKRTQDLAGQPSVEDQNEAETRMTVEKTETGYRVTATQLAATTLRNGAPIDNPVNKVLQAKPAVYVVDESGRVSDIEGFEDIAERVSTELPPELANVLGPLLTEELVKSRGTEEWDGRYGNFAGKEIEIGDVWASAPRVDLIGGAKISQFTATWFEKTTPCGDDTCVRVRMIFNNDLDALESELEPLIGAEKLDGLFDDVKGEAPDDAVAAMNVSGHIERVIHPDTLLPIEESQLRVFTRSEGGSSQLAVTETKAYEFRYEKGGP